MNLEEAKKEQFAKSTRAELRKYAEELNLDNIPDNADSKTLKRAICNALGIVLENTEGAPAPTPAMKMPEKGGDKIFPSYNLTPNGIWGGRRHRLSIPRPDGAKVAQAEAFSWNGKHAYYIAYDEVDAVPEPIYNIIVQNKRRRVKAERPRGGTESEITTHWYFDNAPVSYIGVDEETKNRAGSLLEWYRAKGSAWYSDLSERQLIQVAAKLDITNKEFLGDKIPPRIIPHDELKGRVLEFLFSYADAEVDPNPAIEP